jgi:hypothetical protein
MAQSTTWSHSEVEPTPASSAPQGRRREAHDDPGPLLFLIGFVTLPLTMVTIAWLSLSSLP